MVSISDLRECANQALGNNEHRAIAGGRRCAEYVQRLLSTEPITPERMLELGATLSEDDDDEWWELDGVDVLNAAGMWMVGEVRVHTVGQLLMVVSVVKMQWELEEDAVE